MQISSIHCNIIHCNVLICRLFHPLTKEINVNVSSKSKFLFFAQLLLLIWNFSFIQFSEDWTFQQTRNWYLISLENLFLFPSNSLSILPFNFTFQFYPNAFFFSSTLFPFQFLPSPSFKPEIFPSSIFRKRWWTNINSWPCSTKKEGQK